LPGVHSDIGGGYIDRAPEEKEIAIEYILKDRLEARRAWLIEEGFFLPGQLAIENSGGSFMSSYYILKSKRPRVSAAYIRIPLEIMIKYGNSHIGGEMFEESDYEKNTGLAETDLKGLNGYKYVIQSTLKMLVNFWEINNNSDSEKMKFAFVQEIKELTRMLSQGPSKEGIPDKEILHYTRELILASVFDSEDEGGIQKEGLKSKSPEEIIGNRSITAKAVKDDLPYYTDQTLKQVVLRLLRHRCLHWSAHYKKTALILTPHKPIVALDNRPSENGIRPVYKE